MKEAGTKPLVSICCLTYNHSAYIRAALDGFLGQRTSFPYEVLIHDDASTDGTADIIREYEKRYPDVIKPVLQTENRYSQGITNISGTYNFPRAQGRYIAMCEGDDYWTDPGKLQRQADFMEANPDCSLVFHSAKVEVESRALTERMMRPYRSERRLSPEEVIDKVSGYPTASLMFRTDLVKKLPAYYVNAPIADIPLQLMAAAAGWAYYMDRPMCVYRLGGASSWTELMKQGDREEKAGRYCLQMKEMYEAFDRASGGRFHEAVTHAAERLFFLTKVNTKDYQTVLSPQYREFYRELNLRTRFFIRLETGAPGLYRLLYRLYHTDGAQLHNGGGLQDGE